MKLPWIVVVAVVGRGVVEAAPAVDPPADGKVTVGQLVDNAVKARLKWEGKEVTVTGTLFDHSGVNGIEPPTTMVYLQDPKDKQKQVFCPVQAQGLKLRNGTSITVKGKVVIQKTEVQLGICTIVSA
jgi:hypothetical protein